MKKLITTLLLAITVIASQAQNTFWTRHVPTTIGNIGPVVDGKIWYDQTIGFQFREGGVWKPLAAGVTYGTSGQLPFTNGTNNGFSYDIDLQFVSGNTLRAPSIISTTIRNISSLLTIENTVGDLELTAASGNVVIETTNLQLNGASSVNFNSDNQAYATPGGEGITIDDIDGIRLHSNGLLRGAVYEADYSANFTARSLVDKAYVDAAVAGSGGGWPLTGSAAFTGDVTINGSNTYQAQLNDLKQFNVFVDHATEAEFNLSASDGGTNTGAIQLTPTGASMVVVGPTDQSGVDMAENTVSITSGTTGTITLQAGTVETYTPSVLSTDNSGQIQLETGEVVDGISGNISISTGNATGTGSRGNIYLSAENILLTETPATDNTLDHVLVLDIDGSVKIKEDGWITTTITIPSASILTANTSPVQLIAAPGADKYIALEGAFLSINHGGTDYATNTQAQLRIGTVNIGIGSISGLLNASTDAAVRYQPAQSTIGINQNLNFFVATGNPTDGNSDVKITIRYKILDI